MGAEDAENRTETNAVAAATGVSERLRAGPSASASAASPDDQRRGPQSHAFAIGDPCPARGRAGSLEAIYASAPVGLCFVDCDLRYRNINQALADINGVPAAQHIGRTIHEILPPQLVDIIEPLYRQVIQTGEPIENLHVKGVTRAFPRERDWLVTLAPVRNESGTMLGINAVVQDVTLRNRAQDELRRHAHVLEIINRVNMVLAGELDLKRLLQAVTDAGTQLSGAQFGAFFYNATENDRSTFVLETVSGVRRDEFDRFVMPHASMLFGLAFRTEGVILLDDATKHPLYKTEPPRSANATGAFPELRSYLAVEVISRRGEVIGRLIFGHGEPAAFTGQAQRIVSGIAAQAAVAIDNARLFQSVQRFKFISDNATDAHFIIDRSGRLTYVNNITCDRLGYSRKELLKLRIPDVDPTFAPEDVEALFARLEDHQVKPFESVLQRKDGSTLPVEVSVTGLELDGEMLIFAAVRDISERHRASRERAQLAAIVEYSRDAIIGKDLKGVITTWNKGAVQMYGYTAEEAIGQHIRLIVPDDHEQELDMIMQRLKRGQSIDSLETERLAKDGRIIPVSLMISPVKDRAGNLIGASAIARDISRQKEAEAHHQLLLSELQHRVKNTLTAVTTIAAQTKRRAGTLDEFAETFEGRLNALARAHSLLTRHNWMSANLKNVVERVFQPYGGAERDQISIRGEALWLRPKAALALSMTLHELTTNAIKYGALSVPDGRVEIEWAVHPGKGGDELRLRWAESGGPAVTKPTRQGFGSQLIARGASFELDGKASLEYHPDGFRCEIRFPWTNHLATQKQAIHHDRGKE